jgi:predicted nuclease of predicted toxin-antitoxin system
MRFLVDECTGPTVAQWLEDQGHQVFSIFDETPGAFDVDLVQTAFEDNWILLTNDKDFGELVFRERRAHKGIILLRLQDERASNKINVLKQLLENYPDRLPDQFVVVTETKIRFAQG